MRDVYHYIARDLDHTETGTGWVEVTLLDRYWMQLWADLEYQPPPLTPDEITPPAHPR